MKHPASGFTLLETLVAMFVLGLVVVALAQGLRFGLFAWRQQTSTMDRQGALDTTNHTLRGLISGMMPGYDASDVVINGNPNHLSFIARLPEGAPTQRTKLADIAIGVNQVHELVLRWTPHLHARLLSPMPMQQISLTPGVQAVHFAYFVQKTGLWVDHWVGADPPSLVRIDLNFRDSGRRWPSLIIAPMQQRDAQ